MDDPMQSFGKELEYGERWDVFCAVPGGTRSILDVGCGTGLGFQSLRAKGARIVGVDIDEEAVEAARQRLDEAYVLDIERAPWPESFSGAFDVVAFCDCLEHLIDPWRVLRSVRPLLTERGVVVASVPNVRQIRILLKAALGRWDYVEGAGTVQRGHLRFFTRKTISDMFREAGYDEPSYFFPSKTFHLRRPERALNAATMGRLADLMYGSYTLCARPRRAALVP